MSEIRTVWRDAKTGQTLATAELTAAVGTSVAESRFTRVGGHFWNDKNQNKGNLEAEFEGNYEVLGDF